MPSIDVISGPTFRQGIVSIAHSYHFCKLSVYNAGKQIKSIIWNLCQTLPHLSHSLSLWAMCKGSTFSYSIYLILDQSTPESDTRLKIWDWNSNLTLGINRKFLELWKHLDKETKCSLADIRPVAESTLFGSVSLSLSAGSGLWGLLKACLFD